MAEPQQSQKKNKKKKKSNANGNVNGNVSDPQKTQVSLVEKDAPKTNATLPSALPQKVGMTTKINDVEVTMMKSENQEPNGTTKKKKKKKKKQQQSIENTVEPLPNEEENQNLLNFKENHIELVNHPEISVTISTDPVIPLIESKPEGKSNSVDNKEESTEVQSSTSSKKKKKKKKKKNSEKESTPVPSAPVQNTEDSQSTPTYVKLPADGGNCVLLVSHESFSNGSKQVPDKSSESSTNNVPTVVLKNKEAKKMESSASLTHNGTQNESSSVSIFPVYSDINKGNGKKPEFNVSSSLDKISNLIKTEEENVNKNSDALEVANPTVEGSGEENKPTKAQLKAERRAKQEAQRAAKLAKEGCKSSHDNKAQSSEQNKLATKPIEQSLAKQITITKDNSKDVSRASVEQEIRRKLQIFSHLSQLKDLFSKKVTNNNAQIPPSILELGSHYSKGILFGSNARCVGFLGAVRQVILDYKTPEDKTISKDLESKLQMYADYLNNCRPLSVSIVNAMKFLKHQIKHIPEGIDDERAKESLCESINNFVREEILLAKEAITISASAKIVDNDTILVFAYSSLVKEVLCKAHDQNKKFQVIVVDSRAKLEGLEMLRRLVGHGLQCSYISINAVSYVIKKVNKVIIGAHALLANGMVMSRLGCKILSLVGSTYSVPVLVCCETYKFWERTLTDSIVHNELGNPHDLVTMSLDKKDSLLKWQDLSSLQIYNILYDVTSPEFVSAVITEKGLIPCTSVPVLLRVKHAGFQDRY